MVLVWPCNCFAYVPLSHPPPARDRASPPLSLLPPCDRKSQPADGHRLSDAGRHCEQKRPGSVRSCFLDLLTAAREMWSITISASRRAHGWFAGEVSGCRMSYRAEHADGGAVLLVEPPERSTSRSAEPYGSLVV
jgi:hypothetical protein